MLSAVPLKVLLLLWLGMYRRLWRYASVADVERLLVGAGACALVDILLGVFGLGALGLLPGRLSYGVILLDACLGALAIALPRLGDSSCAPRAALPGCRLPTHHHRRAPEPQAA